MPLVPRKVLATVLMTLAACGHLLLPAATSAAAAPGTPASAPAPARQGDQVTWGAAPADTPLGKGRPHFTYDLAPGARITDAIAVVNRSDTTIRLRVYASDAFTTAAGGIDLLAAEKKPTDVGSWITMKTATITLASQKSAVVPFTLTVPANATPGDHSGGVVTSLVTKSAGKTVQLDRRLGSRLYLRVSGPLAPALTVGEVHATYHGTANPAAGGSADVSYTVTNTGNVRLKAHQRIRIKGLFGLLSQTATVADLPEILPGGSLTRTATVTGVWPAVRLDAQVILQPVASQDQPPISVAPTTAGRTVWAWPWGQLALLAAVAAAVYGYLRLRRRRRTKVRQAISDAVAKALQDTDAHPATGSAERTR